MSSTNLSHLSPSKLDLRLQSRETSVADKNVCNLTFAESRNFRMLCRRPLPWRRGLVLSSPPATVETGAMGREIESRQGIGW
jgi:hypothetical protein